MLIAVFERLLIFTVLASLASHTAPELGVWREGYTCRGSAMSTPLSKRLFFVSPLPFSSDASEKACLIGSGDHSRLYAKTLRNLGLRANKRREEAQDPPP
jgi:hypothetical protein